MIDPIHVFEGSVLALAEVAPWSLRPDEFALCRPITDSARVLG